MGILEAVFGIWIILSLCGVAATGIVPIIIYYICSYLVIAGIGLIIFGLVATIGIINRK